MLNVQVSNATVKSKQVRFTLNLCAHSHCAADWYTSHMFVNNAVTYIKITCDLEVSYLIVYKHNYDLCTSLQHIGNVHKDLK